MNRLLVIIVVFAGLPLLATHAERTEKLAQKERPVYAPRPEYPHEARLHGIQGQGTYALHIRADGSVASVQVLHSAGYRVLDDAVIRAYLQWRFRPAHATTITIPHTFAMEPFRPSHR